jgi:hypothetical protein
VHLRARKSSRTAAARGRRETQASGNLVDPFIEDSKLTPRKLLGSGYGKLFHNPSFHF